MVRTGEVNHLKVKNLLLEVGRIPEHDEVSPKGSVLDSKMIPKKGALLRSRSFLKITMRSRVSA